MESPKAACPRCAYDLSGLIASWVELCPMRCTCSECGLDFDCGRVLSSQLFGPPWCYEHSARPSTIRWWATAWTALNPWRLCRELEVDHYVRPLRLIRFLILWLIIGHFALSGLVIVTGASAWTWAPPGIRELVERCRHLPIPANKIVPALIWPSAFAFTVHGPGLRGYPMGWPVNVPSLPILALVMLPWLLMPLWTVLLDATFRMAKVRQVHLLRGMAYSLPGTLAWFYGLLAYFLIGAMMGTKGWDRPRALSAALFLLYLSYHIAWWHQFIKKYLRLHQATLIVVVHSFMTILAVTAAGAILFAWRLL